MSPHLSLRTRALLALGLAAVVPPLVVLGVRRMGLDAGIALAAAVLVMLPAATGSSCTDGGSARSSQASRPPAVVSTIAGVMRGRSFIKCVLAGYWLAQIIRAVHSIAEC